MSNIDYGLKIESDFTDFYDTDCTDYNALVYKRFTGTDSRGTDLKFLRSLGVKTVELRAAREYNNSIEKLVVYTNPNMHDNKGKIVVSINEAREMYANNLAAPFYEQADGITIKYLQIGELRYRVYLEPIDRTKICGNKVIKIDEIRPCYNRLISQPIFSIDYISNGKEMIAVDYNRVQSLNKIEFNLLDNDTIINEIKKAILTYKI